MPAILTQEEIIKIGESAFDSKNFRFLKHHLKKKSDAALGFLGDHLVLEILAFVDGVRTIKLFFIKTFPETALMGDDFLRETGLFQREVDLYQILFPKMKEVTGEQSWCPKFHYSNEESLVLEDVSQDDFKMAPFKLILDKEHVELTLKKLSAFHASSLLLEEKESKPLNETYPKLFREILYNEEVAHSPYKRWVVKGISELQMAVDYFGKYSNDEKKIIKEKLPSVLWSLYPLNKKSERFKNILIHGDMWRNNLLFKYEDGKPVDCRLVDYQFCRYAPPAHDIMCLLYLTTTRKFRNLHEESLIEYYYDNLKNQAKDLNVEILLPWDSFLESCKHYRLMGLVQALLSMHYVCGSAGGKSEISPDNLSPAEYDEYMEKHRDECVKGYFQNAEYLEIVPEIFHELVENYILNKIDK